MGSNRDPEKSLHERATERVDVRAELVRTERLVEELRVEYEMYFLGLSPYAPDKLHKEVKRLFRELHKAPFKSSESNYRLRTLDHRFRTYQTYWMRVTKQREEGTYSKDVFKANMRERHAMEDAKAGSSHGKAEKGLQALFNSYKSALEKQSGSKQNIDFGAFQKSLVDRAKEYQKKHGAGKLTFKVVVKDGKVSVQAKAKKEPQ